MCAILGQTPLVEDLTGALEFHYSRLLADGLRSNPQRDQAVLTERHCVVGVADDLKEEPPVTSGIPERVGGQAADGETTKDERTRAKRHLLDAVVSLLPDKF